MYFIELGMGEIIGVNSYQLLDLEAGKLEPGSGSLIFLPYLYGDSENPNAKGPFTV